MVDLSFKNSWRWSCQPNAHHPNQRGDFMRIFGGVHSLRLVDSRSDLFEIESLEIAGSQVSKGRLDRKVSGSKSKVGLHGRLLAVLSPGSRGIRVFSGEVGLHGRQLLSAVLANSAGQPCQNLETGDGRRRGRGSRQIRGCQCQIRGRQPVPQDASVRGADLSSMIGSVAKDRQRGDARQALGASQELRARECGCEIQGDQTEGYQRKQ